MHFHVITTVPLVYRHALFKIGRAQSVPVYNKQSHVMAQYVLETEYLAIGPDQRQYTLLPPNIAQKCLTEQQNYCPLHASVMHYSHSPTCVMTMYLRDASAVTRHCITKFLPKLAFPVATYLKSNKWIIASPFDFRLTIECSTESQPKTVGYTVKAPISLFHLEPGCEAKCIYFNLLPYLHKTISFKNKSTSQTDSLYSSIRPEYFRHMEFQNK